MKPTKPVPPSDPAAPWFTPGPEKEAWKKLPGNRYTPEELQQMMDDTSCAVTFLRHPRRYHVA